MSRSPSDSPENHTPISSFLELRQLDTKTFRCDSLWKPPQERGVYGGQLISQMLLSATRSVGTGVSVNSMHCHFLSNADPSTPISYSVEAMRKGKTYCTLMVKGRQKGRWIVSAVCSFQRPEFNQPSYSFPTPSDVPLPDSCPNQEDLYKEMAAKSGIRDEARHAILAHAEIMKKFPIEVKSAISRPTADGPTEDIFWMRLKAMPNSDVSFQKCVLAFLSDWDILRTVSRALGLVRGAAPPNRLAMISSLDHSVWFYNQDFDCTEWLMFVMVSPLAGMGRGMVYGRIYTQNGKIVAMIAQEGVVRAETGGKQPARL